MNSQGLESDSSQLADCLHPLLEFAFSANDNLRSITLEPHVQSLIHDRQKLATLLMALALQNHFAGDYAVFDRPNLTEAINVLHRHLMMITIRDTSAEIKIPTRFFHLEDRPVDGSSVAPPDASSSAVSNVLAQGAPATVAIPHGKASVEGSSKSAAPRDATEVAPPQEKGEHASGDESSSKSTGTAASAEAVALPETMSVKRGPPGSPSSRTRSVTESQCPKKIAPQSNWGAVDKNYRNVVEAAHLIRKQGEGLWSCRSSETDKRSKLVKRGEKVWYRSGKCEKAQREGGVQEDAMVLDITNKGKFALWKISGLLVTYDYPETIEKQETKHGISVYDNEELPLSCDDVRQWIKIQGGSIHWAKDLPNYTFKKRHAQSPKGKSSSLCLL